MSKITFIDMALPEFEIALAKPIFVPLGYCKKLKRKISLLMQIPCVKDYFIFESYYAKLLVTYFAMYKKVNLLEYHEMQDKKLIDDMMKELKVIMQHRQFQKDFIKILNKYFEADFNIKKLMKYIDPVTLGFLFLCIHKIVETVKKKFSQNHEAIIGKVLDTFSSFSNTISKKIEPRY